MAALTLGEALQKSARYFEHQGCESPRLSAELLLARVLNTDRLHLYMEFSRPLTERETSEYREMVRRRGQGEPVAYLLGRKEFYSLEFEVDRSVLIPRPETELLVQTALEILNNKGSETVTVWDVGTGSGAVSVSLAVHKKNSRIMATDVSVSALGIAERNAAKHGVLEQLEFFCADLDQPLPDTKNKEAFEEMLSRGFDVVVSNPPYIASADIETLQREIRDWEPRVALDGGQDGLSVVRRLFAQAHKYLRESGVLLVELGDSQAMSLFDEMDRDWKLETRRDLSGRERVIVAQSGSVV